MVDRGTEFTPDFAIHPGAHLEELLDARGIKKVDFAKRCGRPPKTISEIIAGKTVITPDTALQFERVLGDRAEIWLNLEASYRLSLARERTQAEIEAAKSWARNFPVGDMISKGFLSERPKPAELAEVLFRFFGVSDLSAWNDFWHERVSAARFKQHQNFSVDQFAVSCWLRQTELVAKDISCEPFDESAFREALIEIRSLTRFNWSDIENDLIEICRNAGVALALVPDLRKTGLRGAAYWATKIKPVIALSDRGKQAHLLWFAFFHEAAHIILHSKKAVFIDHFKSGGEASEDEMEADTFAAETLIDQTNVEEFVEKFGVNTEEVGALDLEEFAEDIGISASLLLARLQREEIIPYKSSLNTELHERVEFGVGN